MAPRIHELFSKDIHRSIEEVIKVDDLDDQILIDEIREYHPTESIQEQMRSVLEAYSDLRREPTGRVGVWVSGFFGAGKSSFAKLLGLLLGNRVIGGKPASELFAERITNQEIKVFLSQIREHLPTHVVIFDILKDNIAGAAEHPVTLVMYKALLRSLGYAHQDLDLAALEMQLEDRGDLTAFKDAYQSLHHRAWDTDKARTMLAISAASAALHRLDPATFTAADTWARTRPRDAITPRELADRATKLSAARANGAKIVFVVDEMGQYTARELSRIGDLQGVIESFAQVGRGNLWLIATSQERLQDVIDIYERDRTELARLQDRFAHKVILNPSDIREVASHRVLAKNGASEAPLRTLYQQHHNRLRAATQVTPLGGAQLPSLDEDAFVRLYPLLPYQVDLLIGVVSGLRRQAGGPQTMGGSNRTVVTLTQQLLIHDKVGLAGAPLGRLVTLDNVYDLIETAVSSEIAQEIDDISRRVQHPMALPVAKSLVLLQFADIVQITEESLSAVLHPAVDAEPALPRVREAVEQLLEARKIRRTEQGLKLQSAAERSWDEERDGRRPTRGDRLAIFKKVLGELWGTGAQQPNHRLGGWRPFTGGLRVGAETLVDGNIVFDLRILDPDGDRNSQTNEARKASTDDPAVITWIIDLPQEAERAIIERFRSERMQQRGARTREEETLLRDEGQRLRDANRQLREAVSKALCSGRLFVNGHERSPADDACDPKAEARRVLAPALESLFHRFADGGVKVQRQEVAATASSDSLAGLPGCVQELGLVESAGGQVRLVTDRGVAKEILDEVQQRTNLRQAPSGAELEKHFAAPPFGWPLEAVQLTLAALLRDAKITIVSDGQTIRSASTLEARKALSDNPAFRTATFRPREATLTSQQRREAAKSLEERFGHRCPALTTEAIAAIIRAEICAKAPVVDEMQRTLVSLQLPGEEMLRAAASTLRAIDRADDEDALRLFIDGADSLSTALQRATKLRELLTEPAQETLRRAHAVQQLAAPVLYAELPEESPPRLSAATLADHLQRETFFEHLAEIAGAESTVRQGFQSLYDTAYKAYQGAYHRTLQQLEAAPRWHELSPDDQQTLSAPLRQHAETAPSPEPWRQGQPALDLLRSRTQAAPTLMAEGLHGLLSCIEPHATVISIRSLLSGTISGPEDLETALATIREAVERALADGHPVVLE